MSKAFSRLRRALALVGLVAAASPCLADQPQALASPGAGSRSRMPNIVVIYADDLGYGDVGAYGAKRIPTPNIDALAAGGLRFTNGYAAAATCTPSRYSLLTGEYGFRSQAAILPGDAPALIRPGKATIASVLRAQGYATGVIGKWHLGLGDGKVDWNEEVAPGPLEIGFDYSFLLPATLDRVPTVYLEGHRVVALDRSDPLRVSYGKRIGDRPVGRERPDLLRYKADDQHSDTIINGVSRIGYMQGGKSAEWTDETIHSVLIRKAVSFMGQNRTKPFFLYLPLPEPHVPRLPGNEFVGKTKLGPRGDSVVEFDWAVGEVMAELRRLHLDDNTLVIVSSDNGPVLNDGYEDGAVEMLGDHRPGGPYRGGKYSAFEAGTRIPLITWWPGHIRAGVSNALVSQIDLFASLSLMAGAALPNNIAIDSRNMLDAFLGRDPKGRDCLFTESIPSVAVRCGTLKYIAPALHPRTEAFMARKGIEGGGSTSPQLYDLSRDPGERTNLASTRPGDVRRLAATLASVQAQARASRR